MKFNAPIDLNRSELRNAVVQNLASAPASPVKGQIYYDTGTNQLFFHNGSAFTALSSGTTPDATTGAKGIVQLSGDLAGTATSPTVVGLHLAADTSIGHKLTSVTDPTAAQDAATKNYVDNVAQGLKPKPSAVAATVGSETFTLSAGSVTQIAGTTVDGQTPAINDRILIKDAPAASGTGSVNSTEPGNGLYIVTGNTTNLTVQRDTSMDDANDPPGGSYVFIEGGTANAASGWVVSTPSTNAAFTYGTNNVQWTQFTGAGEITAGTGLTKTGNTLALSTPVSIANGGTNATTIAGARTSLVTPYVYTTTFTGTGAATSFTVTPGANPTLTGAWQVTTVSQSSGAIEYCDITINQSTNVITIAFTTAPANGAVYSVIVVG